METRTARLVGVGVLFLRIISAYIHTYTRVESCKQINIIYLVPCKMYSSYTEKKKKKNEKLCQSEKKNQRYTPTQTRSRIAETDTMCISVCTG